MGAFTRLREFRKIGQTGPRGEVVECAPGRRPSRRTGSIWLFGTRLPASGREARHAPADEVARNSPDHTPAERLRADIYLPLESR
jgi:hypothetical protein